MVFMVLFYNDFLLLLVIEWGKYPFASLMRSRQNPLFIQGVFVLSGRKKYQMASVWNKRINVEQAFRQRDWTVARLFCPDDDARHR